MMELELLRYGLYNVGPCLYGVRFTCEELEVWVVGVVRHVISIRGILVGRVSGLRNICLCLRNSS